MDVESLLAIIVASSSFLSGFITLVIFCKKNKKTASIDDDETDSETSRGDSVSARLPSLITIEIALLLWYLMCCTPLMLLFWFYLPTHYGPQPNVSADIYNIIASTLFVISFIPMYTTHIIRIWLLKLKFHITSLSMLNQLGMIKWKDIRATIWTKIYYTHKWSHNVKMLITISIIFDIILTSIYSMLLSIDIGYKLYLDVIIFGMLTLCLIIGIYSLKSFNDPFNIFREEIIILSVWFFALAAYAIFYYLLWDNFLVLFFTDSNWTIVVTFFGAVAALISIGIHFYFNNKSIQTIHNNLPSLGIIVSTKEGLQTFLRFLVTELSVENLEFFTLSMRWRHRLVLRDLRREKRKSVKRTQFAFNQPQSEAVSASILDFKIANTMTPTSTATAAETPTVQCITPHTANSDKTGIKLAHISELKTSDKLQVATLKRPTSKSIMSATSKKLLALHKRNPANEAQTHLQQLPFPMLTFEFLDRDVVKTQRQRSLQCDDKKAGHENTMTETSYVLEFSKTKTQKLERNMSERETVVSIYFEQYDYMQHIKRGTSRSRMLSTPKLNKTSTLTGSGPSGSKKKSDMASENSVSLKEYDLEDLERGITARSTVQITPDPLTPDPVAVNAELEACGHVQSVQITPFVTGRSADGRSKSLNADDFTLEVCRKDNKSAPIQVEDTYAIVDKLSVLDSGNWKRRNKKLENENTNFRFGGWFDETNMNLDMYDKEWTEEFMSRKRVDYDRFTTLSDDINVSAVARTNLKRFFKLYSSVKLFREAQISEYDNSFEIAWRDVWANLNDSLRRFHRSMFYKEWLHSNAANGLNVMPMHTAN